MRMILKCKMCGGDIDLEGEKTFYTCEYCGSTMTLPKVSTRAKAALYNRANHFRRIGEFDKALAIYENIVGRDNTDAEAHWCCVLCRFGIEYVEDPTTYEFVPTCHRASLDSVLEDVDYIAALEYSDGITKRQYQKDAAKIAEVQRGILATSQNEEPFDIFICYKETDDTTKERTRDSIDAQEIYYQLTQEGYRVFFSRITLEDKAGTEYEPYIFAALNSAKVMVVIGSRAEYLNAVWVKNEWSRFVSLMKKDRTKLLIPCYKEMDPYDLPEQLSVLQSYDMTKIGFVQDLIRGIKKVVNVRKSQTALKETIVVEDKINIEPLLKRAYIALEDEEWEKADEFCEKVLNQNPENAQAYLVKLMAELQVRRQEDLGGCKQPFNNRKNYQKAVRFGDDKIKEMLSEYIECINDRNETLRLNGIYDGAVFSMNVANTELEYTVVAETFKTISGFKDSDALAVQCLKRAEEQRILAEQKKEKQKIKEKEKRYKVQAVVYALKQSRIQTLQSNLQASQSDFDTLVTQEKQLEDQRSRLGIFAGKEKKRIDEELVGISVKKSSLVARINQIKKTLVNYSPVVDVERNLRDKSNNSNDIGAQYENTQENVVYEYSFEKALNIYCDNPEITLEVNKIYPDANYFALLYGKAKVFKLGRYSQSINGEEKSIEWIVLAREGRRVLAISKYALMTWPYTFTIDPLKLIMEATWETCMLRSCLNREFLDAVFNKEEQSWIINSIVTADENPKSNHGTSPGNNTIDKVFLLSITEANKYFSSDSERKCQGTEYCCKDAKKYIDMNCSWWLRSPGYDNYRAAYVSSKGHVNTYGEDVLRKTCDHGRLDDSDILTVRPALWLDAESIIF